MTPNFCSVFQNLRLGSIKAPLGDVDSFMVYDFVDMFEMSARLGQHDHPLDAVE
jgi:hypothetical protein